MRNTRTIVGWAIALGLCLGLGAGAPARAGGRSGTAVSKSDGRYKAVQGLWRCMRGQRCVERKVFRGTKMISEWRKNKHKLARLKIHATALVANVPAKWRPKFQRRWGRYTKKLVAAGFNKKALGRIGMGKSIVQAKRRVALAFSSIKMEYRGRVRTEYVFVVLWKVKRRWYVAYVEDSPGKISRFMIQHKPK